VESEDEEEIRGEVCFEESGLKPSQEEDFPIETLRSALQFPILNSGIEDGLGQIDTGLCNAAAQLVRVKGLEKVSKPVKRTCKKINKRRFPKSRAGPGTLNGEWNASDTLPRV